MKDLRTEQPPTYLEQVVLTPQLIVGYLLNALRYKFSDVRNLENPTLRANKYLWKPDDNTVAGQKITTNILIETANKYDPTKAMLRPAILISRDNVTTGDRLSFGDQWHIPVNLLGNGHDPNQEATMGQIQQLIQINGGMVVKCLGNTGAESDILGAEVFHYFIDYQRVIRQDLGLQYFRPIGLQKTEKSEENKENWITPVMIGYSYQRSSLIYQESPILKAISLEMK